MYILRTLMVIGRVGNEIYIIRLDVYIIAGIMAYGYSYR